MSLSYVALICRSHMSLSIMSLSQMSLSQAPPSRMPHFHARYRWIREAWSLAVKKDKFQTWFRSTKYTNRWANGFLRPAYMHPRTFATSKQETSSGHDCINQNRAYMINQLHPTHELINPPYAYSPNHLDMRSSRAYFSPLPILSIIDPRLTRIDISVSLYFQAPRKVMYLQAVLVPKVQIQAGRKS